MGIARKFRRYCCFADPFFAWPSVFSHSDAVWAHTLPSVDITQKLVGRDLSFSMPYGHGAQLFIDLPEQLDMGIASGQRNPYLAHRDADQRADLQQLEPNAGALGLGQLRSLQSSAVATSATTRRRSKKSISAVDCCADSACWCGR